ncbi:hypothetical protein RUM44_005233 [Polyplax serrata]|uniref:Uncharacterized protein n=1 Tax=Polyplax serrata TaxID=468196 RepID=A0ABR1AEF4_POLSC
MNLWDAVCMGFIYASLLEFVCVNYVGRKRPLHNVVYRPGENPVTQDRSHTFCQKCVVTVSAASTGVFPAPFLYLKNCMHYVRCPKEKRQPEPCSTPPRQTVRTVWRNKALSLKIFSR